jgi:polar amino acid transport system ATP-binding protein/sulfate transport system ATP-binding protein
MASYEVKEPLVTIKDIGLSFGDTPVLRGLSAEVRDIVRPGCVTGQIVGILGPSGVGKTQLSRIMTGLQQPTSGSILVGTDQQPIQAGLVGFVAQNYPLLRHRTVLGNLTVAAMRAGADAKTAESLAKEHLERFGLADKIWDYPAALSGGQRQRIAIAQQILCSKHYIILDEPTTGLDPISKDKVCEVIRQMAGLSEENTIFVVTHDIASVLTVADHLWLLGRVRNEQGASLGARLLYTYDLIERGIAWQERPQALPAYVEIQHEIRARFDVL